MKEVEMYIKVNRNGKARDGKYSVVVSKKRAKKIKKIIMNNKFIQLGCLYVRTKDILYFHISNTEKKCITDYNKVPREAKKGISELIDK